MKGPALFQGEIITKLWKYIDKFKNLSRSTGLISTKLDTKHPWVKGILDYSNEGPLLFPRGDNYEIVKIHWQNIKIFFYRATGPISTKLNKKHPFGKENLSLFKREGFFTLGDDNKIAKSTFTNYKNLLPLNYWASFLKFIIILSHN